MTASSIRKCFQIYLNHLRMYRSVSARAMRLMLVIQAVRKRKDNGNLREQYYKKPGGRLIAKLDESSSVADESKSKISISRSPGCDKKLMYGVMCRTLRDFPSASED